MSLVEQTEKLMTPGLLARLSASLGIAPGPAQRAVKASMSGTLASLTELATWRDGPQMLANAMALQDPDITRSYARQISSSAQPALIEEGADTLGSLFGGHRMSALASAIGKYSGMSKHRAAAVLGVTAPLVLGQLARIQRRQGLDAQGLAVLLNEQRGDIARAMPRGFADLAKRNKVGPADAESAFASAFRGHSEVTPVATDKLKTSAGKVHAVSGKQPPKHSTWRMLLVGLLLALAILALLAASPNGLEIPYLSDAF